MYTIARIKAQNVKLYICTTSLTTWLIILSSKKKLIPYEYYWHNLLCYNFHLSFVLQRENCSLKLQIVVTYQQL
jgi:hypothetical protein